MTTETTAEPQSRIEQRRRKEIVRATAEIVAEEGFEGTTMRKIAARAGVSLGVLNYYYAGKRELVMETIGDARSKMVEALNPLAEAKPGLKLIEAFFKREISEPDSLPMPMSFWLAYWAAAAHDEDLLAVLNPSDSPIDAVFEASLRGAIGKGDLRDDLDARVAADLLRLVKQGARAELGLTSMDPKRIARAVKLALKLMAN
jgi:TetR/AcrR family transcriptional repressor of bet genes